MRELFKEAISSILMKITSEIAEVVGLWLAEGNNKCNNEITFTNNCYDLVLYFDSILSKLFNIPNKRLYIYSAPNQKFPDLSSFSIVRSYQDIRATKPYFIWRVASVKLMKDWKLLVEETMKHSENFPHVLRGYFAGEGNIKTGTHSNRVLRIAQKHEEEWISNILDMLGITYLFERSHRQYNISGKWNWDIFAEHKLADLHPIKKDKFWRTYLSFKQQHYPHLYLHLKIISELDVPRTASWLAKRCGRSQDRVSEVLSELKRNGKVTESRVGHTNHWCRLQEQT